MAEQELSEWTPPKVWKWDAENGGQFANINRPVSGPTHDKTLPVGDHKFQLYSMGTPNGVKVTILFEELLKAGYSDAEYDAWLIRIGDGDQFGSDFVDINPNSKIPALMDYSTTPPTRLFESGAMLLYLAEKFGAFIPSDHQGRTETLCWLMWQMGSAPYVGGGFGHFYNYAPFHIEYAVNRFAMETKRQLDVLDKQLGRHEFVAGDDYTIADMAIWPWYGSVGSGEAYDAGEFLQVQEYENLQRWIKAVGEREGVQRGRMVNRVWGDPATQLRERHAAEDFETQTWDKVGPKEDQA